MSKHITEQLWVPDPREDGVYLVGAEDHTVVLKLCRPDRGSDLLMAGYLAGLQVSELASNSLLPPIGYEQQQGAPMKNDPTKKSVTDYLDALVWDRKPRLDRWLIDYAGAADTAQVRAISRAVLIGAVRRARHPGCKIDEMLVLEGPQGSGKSGALRILAVEDDWFANSIPLGTRAVAEVTAGKWIVDLGELSSHDSITLKAFLASTHDAVRLPYARERAGKTFVVIGTANDTGYLRDETGNRRYWPVSIKRFDLERLRIDRDQLWAEAAAAEATGESIRMESETNLATQVVGGYVPTKPETDRIAQALLTAVEELAELQDLADLVSDADINALPPELVAVRQRWLAESHARAEAGDPK